MSGWRSKKQMSDDRFGISYSWTQPYTGWKSTPSQVDIEMAIIEAVDRLVDAGLTHPVADRILKEMFNKP